MLRERKGSANVKLERVQTVATAGSGGAGGGGVPSTPAFSGIDAFVFGVSDHAAAAEDEPSAKRAVRRSPASIRPDVPIWGPERNAQ